MTSLSEHIHVLGIDTTSKHSSISIFRGDEILVEYNFTTLDGLSASLVPALEFVLRSAGLKLADIDVYGICIGPGLFTGIRVGMATLKGLLFDQAKPVVPVLSLKALAYKYIKSDFTIIPLIDARRDEVYIAGYNFLEKKIKEIIPPQLILIDRLPEKLDQIENVHFVGSGAEVHKELIKKTYHSSKIFYRSSFLASEICKIAYFQFLKNEYITDLQQLLPFYIRKPDAEMNFPE
ncbi:MAG TPA: tRNA (adenosine(37)-N6)-threonylcarbamoyltransferase complex dimerization subunit type 1 TsaB [Candidatus Kapabacteria bacterium]|nr:tRNA (adenosine(37)-N6)-threonylcarbamoyltransferase complex dimerization subunit type 1 TsaB [Candidatus Kapabacteria bacterium]